MRPGVGLTASMSLPWLWGPGRHRVSQAEEEALAELAAKDSATLDAQMEVSEAYAQMRGLEEQLGIVQGEALPAAKRSLEAVSAAFTTGNANLLDWVEVAREVLELEMEIVELDGELELPTVAGGLEVVAVPEAELQIAGVGGDRNGGRGEGDGGFARGCRREIRSRRRVACGGDQRPRVAAGGGLRSPAGDGAVEAFAPQRADHGEAVC